MNFYTIALFLHIVGALGLFVALSMEWMSLRQLRHATTIEQVREGLHTASRVPWLGIVSMVDILIFGVYMMAAAQIGAAWLIVAFWALVVLALIALALTTRRMSAIARMVATEQGSVTLALHNAIRHPLLWISMQTRVAIALGIVFLMTVKPDLAGSLLVMGVAIALGLASALLTQGNATARQQEKPAM